LLFEVLIKLAIAILVGEARSWLPDIVERAQKLVVNGGFEKNADLSVMNQRFSSLLIIICRGPLISPAAKKRVTGLIASAQEEGGKIHLDGRGVHVPDYPHGNFVGPTIIEAGTIMKCYRSASAFFLPWTDS
jgi:malonate-semialdehyde dehydrogenase (acetylating)/methylmalonate-semialdehyde dehydrogenase